MTFTTKSRSLAALPIVTIALAALSAPLSAATVPTGEDTIARWTCIYVPGAGTFCGDDGVSGERPPK